MTNPITIIFHGPIASGKAEIAKQFKQLAETKTGSTVRIQDGPFDKVEFFPSDDILVICTNDMPYALDIATLNSRSSTVWLDERTGIQKILVRQMYIVQFKTMVTENGEVTSGKSNITPEQLFDYMFL